MVEEKSVEAKIDTQTSKSEKILEEMRTLKEELKVQLDRKEEILLKEEKAKAEDALRGIAEAGIMQQPPKEETPAEYKDRMLRGG